MSAADAAIAVSAAEARALFRPLARAPALVLAVSGGPDSTALLLLAAQWRRALKVGPKLVAVTVDHGLRPESAREARAVARLARRLGVAHRTLRWQGGKPATGLQQAARTARYRLLAAAAAQAKAGHILTAHTLDDQAETLLLRMCRGSGLAGLAAMAPIAPLPVSAVGEIVLVRPLLEVPKARLVATLVRAGIAFADDPSNRDSRFTRPRLRELMPVLAREGLDAQRLAVLARRVRRAEAAIEAAVDAAATTVSQEARSGTVAFDAERFARLPAEVGLRLLGRTIVQTGLQAGPPRAGDGGLISLGKLESLHQALASADFGRAGQTMRRTLQGALVALAGRRLTIARAPPRRSAALTTGEFAGHGAFGRR